jgi:hypothetical protein
MKSVRKDSSFIRYAVRLKKGACLFDDAENFLIKHGESIPRLVDKLLNNDFVSARRTDPEYPA